MIKNKSTCIVLIILLLNNMAFAKGLHTGKTDGSVGGSATRGAPIYVAADDSTAGDKAIAKYICDGTDDNVEIQLAVTAGDHTIPLPGSYSTGGTITLDDGDYIEGYGGASITQAAGSEDEFKMFTLSGVNGCLISGLTIDGNKANQTGGDVAGNKFHYGVWINDGDGNVVQNCSIINVGQVDEDLSGYGVYCKTSKRTIIRDCYFSGNMREDAVFYDSSINSLMENLTSSETINRSFVFHDTSYARAINCYAFKPGTSGVATSHGFDINNCSNILLENCSVVKAYDAGIKIQANSHQIEIKKTSVIDSGYVPYTTGTVAVSSGTCTLTTGTWPAWVSNKSFLYIGVTKYLVTTRDSDTELIVVGADVSAGASYEAYYTNKTGVSAANGTGLIFEKCNFITNGNGINLNSYGAAVTSCFFNDNAEATSLSCGIYFGANSDECSVTGNEFKGGLGQLYGMRFVSDSIDSVVVDNIFAGGGTSKDVYDQDATLSIIYSGNVGTVE